MIEVHIRRPTRVVVALLALCALLTGMRIIAAMAGYAGHGQLHLTRRLHMTLLAGERGMFSAKGKARLRCVVEGRAAPIRLGMALLARGAIAPLVRTLIIITVA